MEESEYNEKLKQIETDFELSKTNLYREYGLSQAKYKVGDIIKDHRWALSIDRITVNVMFGTVEPVYHGFELKKDLTKRKDCNRVTIYGNNGVELISK